MRQGITSRSETCHKNILPVIRFFIRRVYIQGIPLIKEMINLEAVRKSKYLSEDRAFYHRNIHGFLLLENTTFHTEITNAMPGAGAHRIINHYQRKSR